MTDFMGECESLTDERALSVELDHQFAVCQSEQAPFEWQTLLDNPADTQLARQGVERIIPSAFTVQEGPHRLVSIPFPDKSCDPSEVGISL